MKKSFLICSLQGRLKNLINLITSIKNYAHSDWFIYLSLQAYNDEETAIIREHCKKLFPNQWGIFSTNVMTGPHLARCRIFDDIKSDIWCILDDDMYAVEGYTKYDNMADILDWNRNLGILSSNWRRTAKMLDKVKLQEKLVKQNIVYTGGGMMIRSDVAEIIKAIPRVQYLFDNPLWSIYSFVNGYDNYRYMGSAAVHEICTKGGRRKWLDESASKKQLPPPEWIRTRRGKSKSGFNEYLICDSTDVTELAKKLHNENKR